MKISEILFAVTDELRACFEQLKEPELQALENAVQAANRVFVAGAGRSLLAIRAVAMRLMHMGFQAYVVGETVTPAILPADLLLIASGSGGTATLRVIAQKAKSVGAKLALITTRPDSPIGELADLTVEVKAVTTKDKDSRSSSVQLGANTFEQSVILIGDAIVTHISSSGVLDEKNEELMQRHANLE